MDVYGVKISLTNLIYSLGMNTDSLDVISQRIERYPRLGEPAFFGFLALIDSMAEGMTGDVEGLALL